MAKNTGLGKGLDALFSGSSNFGLLDDNDSIDNILSASEKVEKKEIVDKVEKNNDEAENGQKIYELKVIEIEPNLDQARKKFDESKIEELAESIKTFGVIQPIIVAKKENHYEIIAGERRWRAAKKAGIKTIPSIIRNETEEDNSKISLIENIQRENLNPVEKARGYKYILDTHNFTVSELAKVIGKKTAQINYTLDILELSDKVLDYLVTQDVSEKLCRVLTEIEDPEIQYEIALYMVEDGISATEAKKRLKVKEAKKDPKVAIQPIFKEIEDKFTNYFGTKTKIKMSSRNANRGQIVIKYNSSEDLERIMNLLED